MPNYFFDSINDIKFYLFQGPEGYGIFFFEKNIANKRERRDFNLSWYKLDFIIIIMSDCKIIIII